MPSGAAAGTDGDRDRGRPEATFTFVHVLVPHPPFVFDAEGNCRKTDEISKLAPRTLYVDQVAYANRLMTKVVTSLLAGSGQKPIIILQADEGPFPARYEKGDRSWREATPDELDTKSGILNADHFPDADYSELYPHVTPVNSFRLLFNKYFGAGYSLLPDRIKFFPDESNFYDFFDVTEKVRSAGNEAEERTVGSDPVAGKIHNESVTYPICARDARGSSCDRNLRGHGLCRRLGRVVKKRSLGRVHTMIAKTCGGTRARNAMGQYSAAMHPQGPLRAAVKCRVLN